MGENSQPLLYYSTVHLPFSLYICFIEAWGFKILEINVSFKEMLDFFKK